MEHPGVATYRAIEDIAVAQMARFDYRPLGPLAERHGTWQLTFQKAISARSLFVVLGILEAMIAAREHQIAVEICVEAGQRSMRRQVGLLSLSNDDLRRLSENTANDSLRANLEATLAHAANLAERVTELELTDEYALEPGPYSLATAPR